MNDLLQIVALSRHIAEQTARTTRAFNIGVSSSLTDQALYDIDLADYSSPIRNISSSTTGVTEGGTVQLLTHNMGDMSFSTIIGSAAPYMDGELVDIENNIDH